jgi:hypothetical protein
MERMRSDDDMAVMEPTSSALVLAVAVGRGGSGKSFVLEELVWRARSQERGVIIADGDMRSSTLTNVFPDEVSRPASDALPDKKEWLTGIFNRMLLEGVSAVVDLGGGEQVLQEYGNDLNIVDLCADAGIDPVALYCLGPDEEDLNHVLSIWEGGYFRPQRALLFLNEGTIRNGKTVAGAFERTLSHPGLKRMRESGVKVILLPRLACNDLVRASGKGLYAAASGSGLDLSHQVQRIMVKRWLAGLEQKRAEHGVLEWMP